MASGPLDLAAWRRMKAVRQGLPAGFGELWNEQAGGIWSVVRRLCQREEEALGWCTSFRMALEESVFRLDPLSPLPPQIGARLFEHLLPAFREHAPVPSGVIPPTAEGIALLPPMVRLCWLIELFFDVSEDIFAVEEGLLPRLRAARSVIEPVSTTDLRAELRQILLLSPPEAALILAPGQDAPPPRRYWWLWIPGIFLSLLLYFAPHMKQDPWNRASAAHIHAVTVTRPPDFLGINGGEPLEKRLLEEGLPRVLTRIPDLQQASFVLQGALVILEGGPAVSIEYLHENRPWTLQHHLRPEPSGLEPLVGPPPPADAPLQAVAEGSTRIVSWRDSEGLWILGAAEEEAEMVSQAALVRRLVQEGAAESTPGK